MAVLAIFLVCVSFARAEEDDIFLSLSPFPRKVFFQNPNSGQPEERKFQRAEIDSEKNALFVLEDGTPLVLPTGRIRAVIPLPPPSTEGFSLSDLNWGYLECSKASRSLPEILPLVTQWESLVSAKKNSLESEQQAEQAAQERAIQEAALEKAAEELAVVLKRLEYFDQLNDRKEIQESLESIKSLNPKLLGDPKRVKEAEDYWSFLLALPPRVAIPKQWPLRVPPEELLAISRDHEAIGPKIFKYVLLAGSFLIPLFCLSRLTQAVREKNWFAAATFLLFGSAVVVLGSGLLMIYPSQAVSLQAENERSFFEKTAWQNGDVLEAQITRQSGKNELQLLVALGSSYGSIPLFFAFDPDFGKPPQLLKVDRASAGAFPIPAVFMQQVWLFVSEKYSWAQ